MGSFPIHRCESLVNFAPWALRIVLSRGVGQGSEVAGNMLAQRTWADIKKCFNDAGKASTLRAVRFRRDTPAINGRTACVFVTRLVHRRSWRRWC